MLGQKPTAPLSVSWSRPGRFRSEVASAAQHGPRSSHGRSSGHRAHGRAGSVLCGAREHHGAADLRSGVEVTAILGAVNVAATYFAFRFIDKAGRRPLALGRYLGMMVFMLVSAADRAFSTGAPKTVVVMVGFSFFISFAIGVGGTGLADPGRGIPHRRPRPRGRDRRDCRLAGQLRSHRGLPGLAEGERPGLGHGVLRGSRGAGNRVRRPVPARDQRTITGTSRHRIRAASSAQQSARLIGV
jgi:Sugar (and other) transporter